MSEKQYRVANNNDYSIGVKFSNGTEKLIRPHSFYPMSRMEIDYLSAVSSLFEQNRQTIMDADEQKQILEDNGIVVENNPYFETDDDMKKHLRASATNIERWLAGVDDRILLQRIHKIAKEMDLASSKMKLIEAKMGIE